MAQAAYDSARHWYDMAQDQDCDAMSRGDRQLERYLRDAFFPKPDAPQMSAEERKRLHKLNVARAWAKKHPPKYSQTHPNKVAATPKTPRNAPASVLRAVEPDTPPEALDQGIMGDVQVMVSLDEHGNVTNARIQSSPSKLLNQAALEAARKSTFTPEIRNGKPVAGEYQFTVSFTSQ